MKTILILYFRKKKKSAVINLQIHSLIWNGLQSSNERNTERPPACNVVDGLIDPPEAAEYLTALLEAWKFFKDWRVFRKKFSYQHK